jgi:hypothetical protein
VATITFNVSALSQAKGPTALSVLTNGYPIPPTLGPTLNGGMLTIKDPSQLAPLGDSTVGIMPITGTDPNNLQVTFIDLTTGATVTVDASIVYPTSSGSSGSSGSSATSGGTTPTS